MKAYLWKLMNDTIEEIQDNLDWIAFSTRVEAKMRYDAISEALAYMRGVVTTLYEVAGLSYGDWDLAYDILMMIEEEAFN